MFRASSTHLQEDTVVHIKHMVLSLSMRVLGGLLVHSLSEFSLKMFTDRPVRRADNLTTILCRCHEILEP